MTHTKPGETMQFGDKQLTLGGRVFTNHFTKYQHLFGTVKAFVTGDECGRDPDVTYLLCDFEAPTSVDMIEEVENRFSKLEGRAVDMSDIKLTDVVMTALMLEPLSEQPPDPNPTNRRPYALTYQVESESGISFGCLGVSDDKSLLLRVMLNDTEQKKARLVEVEETDDRFYFSCEVPGKFSFLEYELMRVPDYTVARKEGAA